MKMRILAVALGALVLGAPALAATSVTIGLTADIRSTDPGVNRDDNTDGVLLNVVEGLVGYGEGGDVKPLLAKSVAVSADGRAYTFVLRDGVTFHNGARLTSDDVLWNWRRYMDAKTGWRCKSEFDGRNGLTVTSVTAPDANTVVMRLDHADAMFLYTLARTDCGMTAMLSRASLKPDGSWDRPIGTGPYKFVEWKPGRGVKLERFTGYRSPPGEAPDGYVGLKSPSVDEVRFTVVPDSATLKLGLQTRSIDVAQLLSSDVTEIKGTPGLTVIARSDSSKNALLFQNRDPLFADKKFRQAIAAALNYPQLVAVASDGLAKPNNSAVFERSVYMDDVQRQGFHTDLAAAKALLAASRYRGQPIKLIANKRAPMPSFQVALVTQSMLQAIGVNVQIEVLDWATQLDRYNSGNYQMMSFSYSARLDPALAYEQFSGDKSRDSRKVWDDPQAIAMIERAKQTNDKAERSKIFDTLHRRMLDDVPLVLLNNGLTVWGVNRRVSGFNPWEGKPRLWSVRVAN